MSSPLKSTVHNFGEPWSAERNRPPVVIEGEEPTPESKLPWSVWASVSPSLSEPCLSLLSPGELIGGSDRWPIITFRKNHAIEPAHLTPEALATRVAECVNFCAGMDLSTTGYATLKDLIASIDNSSAQARREINQMWRPRENEAVSASTKQNHSFP